jgi:hypothetical protein
MAASLVQRAADIGSAFNASGDEVTLAMRSALSGESEPMKRFGVFLSEARVQAEALALGLGDVSGTANLAGKAQAIWSLIMKDSDMVAGDFANTLGESLPNQTKQAKAQFDNLAEQLGEKLLPIALLAMGEILKAVESLSEWWETDGQQWLEDFKAGWAELKVLASEFKAGLSEIDAWYDDSSSEDGWMQRFSQHMDEAGWGVDEFQRGLDEMRDSWGPFWDRFHSGLDRFKAGWKDFATGVYVLGQVLYSVWEVVRAIGDAILWMGRTTLGVFEIIGNAVDVVAEKVGELIGKIGEAAGVVTRLPGFGMLSPAAGVASDLYDFFKADGGPVQGSRPYIVGERGPELFVPGVSGAIVPNHALGGGAPVIHQHFEGVPIGAQLEAANRRLASTLAAASVGG